MSEQQRPARAGGQTSSRPSGPPSRYQRGQQRGGRRGGYRRQYSRRKKVCAFCLDKTKPIDYKDVATMRRFLTTRGKIKSRRKTGNCGKHQRLLAIAIKRARLLALLPFTAEHIRRF